MFWIIAKIILQTKRIIPFLTDYAYSFCREFLCFSCNATRPVLDVKYSRSCQNNNTYLQRATNIFASLHYKQMPGREDEEKGKGRGKGKGKRKGVDKSDNSYSRGISRGTCVLPPTPSSYSSSIGLCITHKRAFFVARFFLYQGMLLVILNNLTFNAYLEMEHSWIHWLIVHSLTYRNTFPLVSRKYNTDHDGKANV